MNKILNLVVAFFGFLLIVGGVLKYMNLFDNFSLSVGAATLSIPNNNSTFFIVAVNILGGFSFLYHSLKTLNFNEGQLFQNKNREIDSNLVLNNIRTLSKLELATGLFTILISFWLLLRLSVIMTAFDGAILKMLPLFIVSIIVFSVYSIIPIILTGKNLSLNNKVGKIIDARLLAEKRKKIQALKEKTKG